MNKGGTPSNSTFGWLADALMRKLLNKPWFVVSLALAALALVANSVISGMRGPRYGQAAAAAPVATAAPSDEPAADSTAAAALPAGEALKALSIPSRLRDPFAPRVAALPTAAIAKVDLPDSVDSLHLSALWTQNGVTLALINDRVCQSGDEVGRIKIESATPDGIWVSHWKGRDFVALGQDFVLKTPAAKPVTVTSAL